MNDGKPYPISTRLACSMAAIMAMQPHPEKIGKFRKRSNGPRKNKTGTRGSKIRPKGKSR